MPTLTKRQKQILDYIKTFIDKNGYSPTFEEIRKFLKLKALSGVYQHVSVLIDKGYITRDENATRGLGIRKPGKNDVIEIPLVGVIAAGQPIEAIENRGETVTIARDSYFDPEQLYALRVAGDSMVDDGIFDGDTVVIKKQESADDGQTVVAIIDKNEATLKRIYRERNKIRLQPANQSLLPIFRTQVTIQGVVVKIIRNFNNEPQKTKEFKTIDLFAGVGGIRLGFEKTEFETVFANDFEQQCKDTYDLNFDGTKLFIEDIQKINEKKIPDFDFLLGGFPCQAFSIAGYRQGFDDEKGRGNLFYDVARILKEKKPMGFMLENVKNLKGHDKGKTFKIITDTLEGLGYHIKSKVLNSMEYGNVPQNRERIYIVGFKDKKHYEKFSFPSTVKLTKKVTDLLEENVDEKYYYNGKPLYKKLKDEVTNRNTVYQWRRKYVRENKKGVCPTLTANMGMGGHNVPIIRDKKGIRKLTPLECARIQGFPMNYKLPKHTSDSALYKQFGNSVTVPVVKAVAVQIKKAIS
ncbi:transcriptional repressor LexA [Candidatus Parcubacteria bacterium]|jgi:DNA (cytosine-5)-methyltransferase 1|nr:transcriptional repressor LexA [Candidatus Parcubacteria bacterium]MBT3949056.1 transcriptional repressor LexA [Candidatus Parcubacteria bacterium]